MDPGVGGSRVHGPRVRVGGPKWVGPGVGGSRVHGPRVRVGGPRVGRPRCGWVQGACAKGEGGWAQGG